MDELKIITKPYTENLHQTPIRGFGVSYGFGVCQKRCTLFHAWHRK